MAVEPSLYPEIEGSTDSEMFFYLALTFGLEHGTLARAVAEGGRASVEDAGRRHGIEHPIQMTVATTDGDTTWAFRYSSERNSRSLFHSTTSPCSATSTRTTPYSTSSRTMRGWWCPNRWGISAGHGRRYRKPRASLCTAEVRNCTRLRPQLPNAAAAKDIT